MGRQQPRPLLPPPGLRQHLIDQVPRHHPGQHPDTDPVRQPSARDLARFIHDAEDNPAGRTIRNTGGFPQNPRVSPCGNVCIHSRKLTKRHCSNYTSAEFAAALEGLGIRQSVGRTGICFDNALAESFNAAVKVERVHRTVYPTRKKAQDDIARYIELRYNQTRLHSALGYRTPHEVHDEYLNRQLAA